MAEVATNPEVRLLRPGPSDAQRESVLDCVAAGVPVGYADSGDERHAARAVVRVPNLRVDLNRPLRHEYPTLLDQPPLEGSPRRIGTVLWLAGVRVDSAVGGRRIVRFRQRHPGQQIGRLQLLGEAGAVAATRVISFAAVATAGSVLFGSATAAAALVRLLAAIRSKLGVLLETSTRLRSP